MKTKRYRAATMREALEQVKQELGEEALVIDSKRVRAGGLPGFVTQEMFKVRVATASPLLPASRAKCYRRRRIRQMLPFRRRNSLYGTSRLAITKLDETIRPGADINFAADVALPLLYLYAGQRVPEDSGRASAAVFSARILSPAPSPLQP